jgi:hypothetical protein
MFNCSCHLDYDPCDVWDSQMVTARKSHVCCECGEEIAPGRRYERLRTLYKGSWDTFKTCTSCLAVWDDLCDGDRIPTLLVETLWETNGIPLVASPDDEDWWGADE